MFNQLEDQATGPTCEFNPLRQNNVHPIDHQVDHVDSDRGRKSISSPSNDHKGTHHDVVKDQIHAVIKQIKTRQVMSSENPTEFEKDIPTKEKVSAGKVAQEDRKDRRRNNKEEEKESSHKSWEDSLIGPASPSFKEYCMDSSSSSGCSDDGKGGPYISIYIYIHILYACIWTDGRTISNFLKAAL